MSSHEALFRHHVLPVGTPILYFYNCWTLIMATSVVREILKMGNNTYSFQAQGNTLCQGLFVERTIDAVPRK
jgi:hypothetical protein